MNVELDRDQIACIRHALIVDRDAAYARIERLEDGGDRAEARRYALLCTVTLVAIDAQTSDMRPGVQILPPAQIAAAATFVTAEAHRATGNSALDIRQCGAVGTERCRWVRLPGGRCAECRRRG